MHPVTILLPIHRTEGNREWLDQAIRSFPKGTRYMVLENDGEVVEALNAGLKAADTEFVVAFGADDIALPGYLEQMLRLATYADVVYPSMTLVDENLEVPLGEHPAWPFCGYRLAQMNYIAGPSLVRRSKVLELGGWRDVEFEDWDLWMRIHRDGGRFKPAPDARLLYRQVEGSRRRAFGDVESLRESIVGKPDPLDEVKATFYAGATAPVTYVRCQLPARSLPAIVRRDVNHLTDGDDIKFHEHIGAAVFQFAATKYSAIVSGAMRGEGIRTLVEMDDNYLDNPGKRIQERSGWKMRIGESEASSQGHAWNARWADGLIVSTPYLADRYREVNENIYVCPNSVDPADWPVPDKPDDGIFRIAWVAAQSHEDDIPIVTRAFEWASAQPNVKVYMVGLDPNTRLKFKQRWRFPYTQLTWIEDMDAYRHVFQLFDLGVAPVSRNSHGLGRSDLKALEYLMGGALPVVQNAVPYEWWRDKPVLMAENSEGFLKQIKWAVANQDEVRQLAADAQGIVLRERTNSAQRHLYEEAIAA